MLPVRHDRAHLEPQHRRGCTLGGLSSSLALQVALPCNVVDFISGEFLIIVISLLFAVITSVAASPLQRPVRQLSESRDVWDGNRAVVQAFPLACSMCNISNLSQRLSSGVLDES
jgi:hypothetical protein